MQSNDDKDMAARRKRAIYRASHRGTREMDFMLGVYAESLVPQMSSDELVAFEEFMTLPDPVLTGALIDGAGEFPPETTKTLAQIRQFHNNKK